MTRYASASEYWAARKARDEARNGARKARTLSNDERRVMDLRGYCFCAGTPLSVDRCPECGKRPYTD